MKKAAVLTVFNFSNPGMYREDIGSGHTGCWYIQAGHRIIEQIVAV